MDFIAAGFDPMAFGGLTLRRLDQWMRGAVRRDALQMALTARATWAGSQLKSEDLNTFVDEVLGEDAAQRALPPEALTAMLARQSRGMSTITRAEALKRMH